MIFADFSSLIGNDQIKRYLERMIDRKTIANSLLFAGIDGIGKSLFAETFAIKLVCENSSIGHKKALEGNHPDIHHYRPEGKLGLHSIQSLRHLIDAVHMPPTESEWKVFIIHEADRMLPFSSNALLKTFEEPPKNTVIILLSSSPESILPTVLSRCRTIYFQSLPIDDIERYLKDQLNQPGEQAKKIAALSHGSIGKAIELSKKGIYPYREMILKVLAEGKFKQYQDMIASATALSEQIDLIKQEVEQAAREEWSQIPNENLTASQQGQLEKELEGIVSTHLMHEAYSLFNIILSWYRDLHLILAGGNRNYLINSDFDENLEQAVQKGNIPSLESVEKHIQEARLALQRSVSIQICLESLFLKLNLNPA